MKGWIERPKLFDILEKALAKSVGALTGIRTKVKAGEDMPEAMRVAHREYLDRLLPTVTRSGLEVGDDLRARYIEQAEIGRVPSLAIETAISNHEWGVEGGADRNTQIDKMHLIAALPYADEIVSDDKLFHSLHPVAAKTGHVRARLLRTEEFLQRF